MNYKILVFKYRDSKFNLGGIYASLLSHSDGIWGRSDTPTLQPMTANIATMELMYDKYDFNKVEFIEVEVIIK